jgi:phosphoribosyl-ATP pyrophosphohydrolase
MAKPPPTHIIDRLYTVILSRREADPAESNTARLFSRGVEKISQKLGEEAVETVIEAINGKRKAVVSESADLLYHLLVLWAARGIDIEDVWAELARREGISGITEKESRKKDGDGDE